MRRCLTVCVALAASGCAVGKGATTDSADGVIVVDVDSARRAAAMHDSIAPIVPDARAVSPAPAAVPVPAPARTGPRDTTSVTATTDELLALRASLIIPVQGITSDKLLDSYTEARGGNTRKHEAIDIPAPRGTPVLAAANGRILRKFTSRDGGLMIYSCDASERFILMYAHLDRYAEGITDGMAVKQGTTIGYVGTTGNAPPDLPHLHFAIARVADVRDWWRGTPVNPYPLLR